MPKILIVLTGSDHWTLSDGTQHPTGFWAEELLSPLQVFSDAGIGVDLASPEGRTPVDELIDRKHMLLCAFQQPDNLVCMLPAMKG